MKIKDKISLDAIRSTEDIYANSGSKELLNTKLDTFVSSGLDRLLTPVTSIFNQLKGLIGNYLNQFTNSVSIVEANKDGFFSNIQRNIDGDVPEDLRDG